MTPAEIQQHAAALTMPPFEPPKPRKRHTMQTVFGTLNFIEDPNMPPGCVAVVDERTNKVTQMFKL